MRSLIEARTGWALAIAIAIVVAFGAWRWNEPPWPPEHPQRALSLELTAVEASNSRPVSEAFIVAREFTFGSGPASLFAHSSGGGPVCYRGAIGRTDTSGLARLTLPGVSAAEAEKFDVAAYVGWLVYAPGSCAPGRLTFNWAPLDVVPDGGGRGTHTVVPGEATSYSPQHVQVTKAVAHGERRIRYLSEMADVLNCQFSHWAKDFPERKVALTTALVAEAESEIKTEFDRYLVEKLKARLDPSLSPPANPTSRIQWVSQKRLSICRKKAKREEIFPPKQEFPEEYLCGSLSNYELTEIAEHPGEHVLTCGFGAVSECDVNWRDAEGYTSFMRFVAFGQGVSDRVDHVRALLAAGADPNIEQIPSYGTGLDKLLQKWLTRGVVLSPEDSERLSGDLRVLQVIADDGRATMHPAIRAQLETPEDQWRPTNSEIKVFYHAARDLTRSLAMREPVEQSCAATTYVPPVEFWLTR